MAHLTTLNTLSGKEYIDMNIEKKRNVKIGEKTYVIASDDDYLEHIGQEFEPHMVSLFEALIKRNDVVFDVGANIGCTSILFGDLSSRVFSFEPSPTTFRFLKENIAQSGLKNIEPQNYALGSQQGESEIMFAPSNRSGAFVSNKTKASVGHTSEHIVIKRVDDIFVGFNVPRVDFIKIDVEGFEKEVIDGAKKLISEFEPIVVLELNHRCLNAFQRITVPDFFDYLRATFPILLAIEGMSWLNIHDESDSYVVMYNHIIHFKYSNIVAAFSKERLSSFYHLYARPSA